VTFAVPVSAPNAVGKTKLLDAIRFLYDMASQDEVSRAPSTCAAPLHICAVSMRGTKATCASESISKSTARTWVRGDLAGINPKPARIIHEVAEGEMTHNVVGGAAVSCTGE